MKTHVALCLVALIGGSVAGAYDVRDYEEPAGLSIAGVRDTGGDVYGGGFESGVWWKGTPVFGELFGHWLVNKLQDGNYYSVGMSLRLMPRGAFAPFAGVGGSYNGLTSKRDRTGDGVDPLREPDRAYWKGHAEAGFRVWLGPYRAQFFEATFRQHWTDTGNEYHYGWVSLEYGQMF